VTRDDVAVTAQRGDTGAAASVTDEGYLAGDVLVRRAALIAYDADGVELGRLRLDQSRGIESTVDTAGLDGLTLRPDLANGMTLRPDGADDPIRDICAAAVTALLRASARPGRPRLKACRGEDCRWVFLDGSRNTSRRWCDMAQCGNRAKSVTFRLRHRAH
jgi:hypothetical protein